MDNSNQEPAFKRQRRSASEVEILKKGMLALLHIDQGIVEAKEWGEYDIVKKCLESKVDQTELDSLIHTLFLNPTQSLILSSSIGRDMNKTSKQLLPLLQKKHDEQAHVMTQLKVDQLYVLVPEREKIQMEIQETSKAIRKLQSKLEELECAQELNNSQISVGETKYREGEIMMTLCKVMKRVIAVSRNGRQAEFFGGPYSELSIPDIRKELQLESLQDIRKNANTVAKCCMYLNNLICGGYHANPHFKSFWINKEGVNLTLSEWRGTHKGYCFISVEKSNLHDMQKRLAHYLDIKVTVTLTQEEEAPKTPPVRRQIPGLEDFLEDLTDEDFKNFCLQVKTHTDSTKKRRRSSES